MLDWVTVLADQRKVFLILMMNFVIFVEFRYFMEGSMDEHIEDIISNHDDNKIFDDFEMGWEVFKPRPHTCTHNSNEDKERVDNTVINYKVFEGCPFYLLPVLSLPVGL